MDHSRVCLLIWAAWWSLWLLAGVASKANGTREPLRCRAPHLVLLVGSLGLMFAPAIVGPHFSLEILDGYRTIAIGGILAGLGFACWARVHLGRNWSGLVVIKKDHELVKSGPYAIVRHPIYTGLVVAMAFTAISVSTVGAIAGAVLFAAAFVVKLSHEERMLGRRFKTAYSALCEAVPDRLIPGVF